MKQSLRGAVIGAGYFSRFHYEAWAQIPEVSIVALGDQNVEKAREMAERYQISQVYTDYREMFLREKPDFVDIITPPATHVEIVKAAADAGVAIICQKPLAPTLAEAEELVKYTQEKKVPFMVHENFRFQPWYREIKKMLDNDIIGDPLQLYFRMRMGDGWPEDAYLARQPYFREMPRLLIYETGIHFIDTFRYLLGEVDWVFARLRQLNPNIQGEDAGLIHFGFQNQATALWDASRYHEPNFENARYTFGEMLLEGRKGGLRLYGNGDISLQLLGEKEKNHPYTHEDRGFSGNCVYFTQKHFVESLIQGSSFETNGPDYLQNLRVQEGVYASSEQGEVVKFGQSSLMD